MTAGETPAIADTVASLLGKTAAAWLRDEHRILDHLRGTGLAPGSSAGGTTAPDTRCW